MNSGRLVWLVAVLTIACALISWGSISTARADAAAGTEISAVGVKSRSQSAELDQLSDISAQIRGARRAERACRAYRGIDPAPTPGAGRRRPQGCAATGKRRGEARHRRIFRLSMSVLPSLSCGGFSIPEEGLYRYRQGSVLFTGLPARFSPPGGRRRAGDGLYRPPIG